MLCLVLINKCEKNFIPFFEPKIGGATYTRINTVATLTNISFKFLSSDYKFLLRDEPVAVTGSYITLATNKFHKLFTNLLFIHKPTILFKPTIILKPKDSNISDMCFFAFYKDSLVSFQKEKNE